MERESFIFYKSFEESINDLPEKDQLPLYKAIACYALYGQEPDLAGLALTLFKLIRPQLDANTKRYLDGFKGKAYGKLGGRPRKNPTGDILENPTGDILENPTGLAIKTPNNNENENVNENKNNTTSDKSDSVLFLTQVKDILTYLNEKAGTAYRASSKTTQQYIRARMKEGYTLEDFRTVINKKCAEWLGTDQAQYLRPETLFRPGHFESYLNQPEAPARQRPAAGQNRNRFMNFQQRSDQEHKNLVNAVIAQSMQH